MATELVNAATSEKLTEMDWMKSIEICELVAHDHRVQEYSFLRDLSLSQKIIQLQTLVRTTQLMGNLVHLGMRGMHQKLSGRLPLNLVSFKKLVLL